MSDPKEEFLAHYGIPGMKWGQRKGSGRAPSRVTFTGPDGQPTKKKYPAKASQDFVTSRELKRKGKVQLSNADLKKVNERLQLEKKMSDLNPSRIKQGAKIIGAVAGTAGSAAALYNVVNGPAGKAAVEAGQVIVANLMKPVGAIKLGLNL